MIIKKNIFLHINKLYIYFYTSITCVQILYILNKEVAKIHKKIFIYIYGVKYYIKIFKFFWFVKIKLLIYEYMY